MIELWEIVEIKSDSKDMELLEIELENYRQYLACAELGLETEMDEIDIEIDVIKQLLQSNPIDERFSINISEIVQVSKAFYSLIRQYHELRNKPYNKNTAEQLKYIRTKLYEILSKLNANEQYYLLYYYAWRYLDSERPKTSFANIRRKRERQKKKLSETIKELYYNKGLTRKQIAQLLNISERTVTRYLREYANL